jgi:hypothetical protein
MKIQMKYINLYHALIIGTTLMYIGYKKEETHKYIFYLIGLEACLIPFIVKLPTFNNLNYWNSIKLFHYIIIIPWLLYLSYNKKVSKNYGEVLFSIGLGITLYHSYKALIRFNR